MISCLIFFSFTISIFFSYLFVTFLPVNIGDYRFEIMETKVDTEEENDKVEGQGSCVVRLGE